MGECGDSPTLFDHSGRPPSEGVDADAAAAEGPKADAAAAEGGDIEPSAGSEIGGADGVGDVTAVDGDAERTGESGGQGIADGSLPISEAGAAGADTGRTQASARPTIEEMVEVKSGQRVIRAISATPSSQGRLQVTREVKLALIVAFALVLLVAVVIGDHFSKASRSRLAMDTGTVARDVVEVTPEPTVAPAPPAVSPTSTMVPPGQEVVGQPAQAGGAPAFVQVDGIAGSGQAAPGAGRTIAVGPDGVPVSEHAVDLSMGGQSGSSNANGTSTTGSGLSRILDQDLSRVPPSTTIDTRDVNGGVPADPNANGGSATGGGVVVIGPRDQVRESGRDATSRPQTPAPEADKALPLTSGRLLAHPVKAGDTLIAIARRYYGDESVVERLAAYNKNRVGPRNSLRVGVTLRIPPRDVLMGRARLADDASPSVIPSGSRRAENSPTNTARETATGRTTPSSTSTASATTYTVKAGDTLGTIARATLGTSKRWREIFDANRTTLSDEDSLKVGMKLKIPAR